MKTTSDEDYWQGGCGLVYQMQPEDREEPEQRLCHYRVESSHWENKHAQSLFRGQDDMQVEVHEIVRSNPIGFDL